ncbi:aldo/keto reductase [Ottowia sp. SB7-C50]|nr:aldo/keto reductase [Ottowia sp. SB7-C50]WOP16112.1 aldo/keto reductase [Ottowia sp. SB7-C50]
MSQFYGASDDAESLATLTGATNARLVDQLGALAREWGLANAQLALSWLLVGPSHVIPIPGTRRVSRLDEHMAAADVKLAPAQIERVEAVLGQGAAQGCRYAEAGVIGMETPNA